MILRDEVKVGLLTTHLPYHCKFHSAQWEISCEFVKIDLSLSVVDPKKTHCGFSNNKNVL